MPAAKPRIIAFVIPFYYEQAGIQHTLVFVGMSVDLRYLACGSDGPGLDPGHVAFFSLPHCRPSRLRSSANASRRSISRRMPAPYIVEEEIGIVPAMPESENVRNRTEATQTSRNGYSRVSV